uniref:Uncharacterized protein n=1 Tax=Porphyridium purpureum TaxID=35688 RepID=W0RYM7_PORPP|nr:hypothetical protein Y721_p152 [Porphyridium purpureum]BAO23656.1 hypothetical protein [Porphyridium purpureum]
MYTNAIIDTLGIKLIYLLDSTVYILIGGYHSKAI